MQKTFDYIDRNFDTMVEELQKFCAQPSIAAQNKGMKETAEMLAEKMREAGIPVLPHRAVQMTRGDYEKYNIVPLAQINRYR